MWYKDTAGLEAEEMVDELRDKGFAGIYLDRDGFENTQLEEQLCAVLGLPEPTLTSDDGRLIYLSLT